MTKEEFIKKTMGELRKRGWKSPEEVEVYFEKALNEAWEKGKTSTQSSRSAKGKRAN